MGDLHILNYVVLANMQRLGLIPGCTVTPAQFMQAAREPCKPCIQSKNVEALHPLGDDETNELLGLIAFDMTSLVKSSMDREVYLIGAVTAASTLARGA